MFDIRPMTSDDVGSTVEMTLRGGWGDRRRLLEFAIGHAECRPIVATDDGEIVGTGFGTANGNAGWIGAIFVAQVVRRRGIGRAITDRIIDDLVGAGCRTFLLVASDEGRPMYEAMGFELQTAYATLEAPGTLDAAAAEPSLDTSTRPFEPADLAAMVALDRGATGEDRAHLLSALAAADAARVLVGPGGDVDAFVIRAPWGGGATIARSLDDGVRLLEARRAVVGPDRLVRAGLPREHREGIRRLKELGWKRAWNAPRMIRGEPLRWRPERIYGQFAMALG